MKKTSVFKKGKMCYLYFLSTITNTHKNWQIQNKMNRYIHMKNGSALSNIKSEFSTNNHWGGHVAEAVGSVQNTSVQDKGMCVMQWSVLDSEG